MTMKSESKICLHKHRVKNFINKIWIIEYDKEMPIDEN